MSKTAKSVRRGPVN